MNVRIIKKYYDTTKNMELIEAGTEFEVSAERGQVLINAKVAEEIKPKEKEVKEKTKKQK